MSGDRDYPSQPDLPLSRETPDLPLFLLVESLSTETVDEVRMTLVCPDPQILCAFVGRNELLTHAQCDIFTRYVANQVFSFPQLRNNVGGVEENVIDLTLHYLDATIDTSRWKCLTLQLKD